MIATVETATLRKKSIWSFLKYFKIPYFPVYKCNSDHSSLVFKFPHPSTHFLSAKFRSPAKVTKIIAAPRMVLPLHTGTASSSVISCIFLHIEENTMSPRESCCTWWHVEKLANISTETRTSLFSALVRILLSLVVVSQGTERFPVFKAWDYSLPQCISKLPRKDIHHGIFHLAGQHGMDPVGGKQPWQTGRRMLKLPMVAGDRTAPPRERNIICAKKPVSGPRDLELLFSMLILFNPLLQGN